jgi:hypothetical protein
MFGDVVNTNLSIKKTMPEKLKEGMEWYCERFDMVYLNLKTCEDRLNKKEKECSGCNGPKCLGKNKDEKLVVKKDKPIDKYQDKIDKILSGEQKTYLFLEDGYYYMLYKGEDGNIVKDYTGILEQHKSKAAKYRTNYLNRDKISYKEKHKSKVVEIDDHRKESIDQESVNDLKKPKRGYYYPNKEYEKNVKEEFNIDLLFKGHLDLLKKLKQRTEEDFRISVKHEILYIIKKYLNGGF